MKWEKKGQIFIASEVLNECEFNEFSKSPQAVVFDDFVRVYFCSQRKSDDGKYISLPMYVDFDLNFSQIINICRKPIVSSGLLGEFDEHGIFPFNVVRVNEKFMAYTTGWSRRKSVSIDMAIGLTESFDFGHSFQKVGHGGPIMAASNQEPFLVGDAFVLFESGTYHMWYIFGDKWELFENSKIPERRYRIAYSSSLDGINWNRSGKYIIDKKLLNECQALPTVIKIGDTFHMYFCYRDVHDFRNNLKNAYKLGYAFSKDGLEWTRADEISGISLSETGWDSEMMCYPNIFKVNDKIFMLYNGNEFGKHGFGLAELISQD